MRIVGAEEAVGVIQSGNYVFIHTAAAAPLRDSQPPERPWWGNPWLWVGLCVMGLMATVGHFMLILAYQRAPASTLTPYLYAQIAFAMLGGWIVFAHVPDGWSVAGRALIAACGAGGAWLTVRERRPAQVGDNRPLPQAPAGGTREP